MAEQTAGAVANPLNFDTPFSDILNTAPDVLNKGVASSIYNTQKGFLDPQWDQQQTNLQDQLSRQGIGIGNTAYSNAQKQFDNSRTQAYQAASSNALEQGRAATSQQFGLAQAGQQQNIQQQQLARTMPLSLLSMLNGSTPATPTQPIGTPGQTAISPTDLVGATGIANKGAYDSYKAQVDTQNANTGGAASLAAAAATAAAAIF